MKSFYRILTLMFILLVVSSCVTQKRKDDLSWMGKLYHNTTAHYNGYFNAREIVKASILQLEQQHQDNYTQLLDLYQYMAADNTQAVSPGLDEAIKKASVVVSLHRQSQWTDDCYLLVGQAQFLKQDFEAAEETFRFMADEFNPEKTALKKQVSKRAKQVKKSRSSSAGRDDTADQEREERVKLSQREKKQLVKQQQRERKKYNREVKKNRKKTSSKKNSAKKRQNGKTPNEQPALADSASADPEKTPAKTPAAPDRKKEDKKDRGKEKEPAKEPDSDEDGWLKHRPVYQEGILWLARTLIERDKFDNAQRLIRQLEEDPKTFDEVRSELVVVKAYFHLEKKDWDLAAGALEEAIERADQRSDKARYAYILAQIHQKRGRPAEAYAAFERVSKYAADYEMVFSSRLKMTQTAWQTGMATSEDTRQDLNKMLKEDKNQEYQDQVYYALAEIDLKEGQRREAIENLRLSLKNGSKNPSQRAESYLKLANLYFEEEDFVPAKNYFDSTLQVLAESDERYPQVRALSNNLTDIAKNIQTITLQDSLLQLTKMSMDERRELAQQVKEKQDQQRIQELADRSSQPEQKPGLRAPSVTPSRQGAATTSSFFAYDEKNVKRGKRDFEQKWGTRPLEDNWRRSNRRGGGEFEEVAEEKEKVISVLTDDEVNQLLGGVPQTDEEIRTAEISIQEAMFNLGALYRERLKLFRKAADILEELNQRFPKSKYQLDSWYYLYLAYIDLDNPTRAAEYRDLIVANYAGSSYAQVLTNPNYLAEQKEKELALSRYYDEAYAAFTAGRYQEAFDKSQRARERFGANNDYQARFALLSAMCAGNIQGKEAYIAALREVVGKYPNTDEQRRAREILRLLGDTAASLPGEVKEEVGQFKDDDKDLHYIIIVFQEDSRLNDAKISISDYNQKFFQLEKLRISNIYLGTSAESRIPIIVVRRFKDKAESMKYFQSVMKNKREFMADGIDYEIFSVSQNNYREILRLKSVETYRQFFEWTYLD